MCAFCNFLTCRYYLEYELFQTCLIFCFSATCEYLPTHAVLKHNMCMKLLTFLIDGEILFTFCGFLICSVAPQFPDDRTRLMPVSQADPELGQELLKLSLLPPDWMVKVTQVQLDFARIRDKGKLVVAQIRLSIFRFAGFGYTITDLICIGIFYVSSRLFRVSTSRT